MGVKSANNIGVISSRSTVGDYISLLKPRVMLLAVFTSLCGLWVAPTSIHPFLFVLSIFCISLGAGAAGAINMWFDRDIDSLMERTKKRPIPVGKIEAENALGFGVMLSVTSVLILGLSVNYLAAFLLAFSIFFLYFYLYNLVKKKNTSKHCYWWGRGCFSSCYWVGLLNWSVRYLSSYIIFINLYLDSSTFLGFSFI